MKDQIKGGIVHLDHPCRSFLSFFLFFYISFEIGMLCLRYNEVYEVIDKEKK